ncbi:MAG: phosphotransferase [Nostoc sp. DedVER02]|uniref:phosphotransferase n=1 Tax=unclassified Nostoc TaxID=2593658 RepID=UPI002AD397B0|nr:phosphotransferase [Nostoc sp. DedVER02]MDZ7989926.1 phosphotransferase [Nostoc sp. DedVER02]MDZ8112012.1 phosphotransferase [Nostoc sp. DedVER01b]
MNSPAAHPLIDEVTLTPVVRRILDSKTATVGEWHAEAIAHHIINHVTAGLQRITGIASDRSKQFSWSVILKILHIQPENTGSIFNSSQDSTHWNYWQREALIYTSGILNNLTDDLVAPRCFAITEPSANVVWLWLEDIQGNHGSTWTLERFGIAARHLGYLQGSYVMAQSLPSEPWFSRDWHRAWVSNIDSTALEAWREPTVWQHPLLKEIFSPDVGDRLMDLWSDRHILLDAVNKAPHTLCHFDISPNNLFSRHNAHGNDQTVLIDWSFVGHGVLGEDIVNLVLDSIFLLFVDGSSLIPLEKLVLEGYLAGLRSAGWNGNECVVRFTYAAVAALHFGLIAGRLLKLVHNESRHSWLEQRFGRTFEEIITSRAIAIAHGLELADEARLLLRYL